MRNSSAPAPSNIPVDRSFMTSGRLRVSTATSIVFTTVLQPINASVIAVALVALRERFGVGDMVLLLVSALYLTTAVSAPTMGRLADMISPRTVALTGLAMVAVASVVASLVPSFAVLVVCRAVIGMGTAAQYPCALAMVRSLSDPMNSKPHGVLSAITMCSQAFLSVGPALGGLALGLFGPAGIFWLNLPLTVVAALMLMRWVPRNQPAGRRRIGVRAVFADLDVPGMVLFLVTASALMLLLMSLAGRPRWWWLAVLVPAAALLVIRSRRADTPFLDLRLLTNRRLSTTYVRAVAIYAATYSAFYGLPLWMETSRRLSPNETSLLLLPVAVVAIASTAVANSVSLRWGSRTAFVAGAVALAVAGLLVIVPTAHTSVPVLLLVGIVLSLPGGLLNIANQASLYYAAPPSRTGTTSGLYRTSQYIGASLSTPILALLGTTRGDDAGLHHLGMVLTLIGAALLVTGVPLPRSLRSLAGMIVSRIRRATSTRKGSFDEADPFGRHDGAGVPGPAPVGGVQLWQRNFVPNPQQAAILDGLGLGAVATRPGGDSLFEAVLRSVPGLIDRFDVQWLRAGTASYLRNNPAQFVQFFPGRPAEYQAAIQLVEQPGAYLTAPPGQAELAELALMALGRMVGLRILVLHDNRPPSTDHAAPPSWPQIVLVRLEAADGRFFGTHPVAQFQRQAGSRMVAAHQRHAVPALRGIYLAAALHQRF